jgi:hypothetical protein
MGNWDTKYERNRILGGHKRKSYGKVSAENESKS